jgi:hypothetical protein
MNRTMFAMTLPILALAVGCSSRSLLGGPGPAVAHHASPAASERLAEHEAVRAYKTAEQCRQGLVALAHVDPAALVEISKYEVRGYHSAGDVHHEYSCVGSKLLERSWKTASASPTAHHGPAEH